MYDDEIWSLPQAPVVYKCPLKLFHCNFNYIKRHEIHLNLFCVAIILKLLPKGMMKQKIKIKSRIFHGNNTALLQLHYTTNCSP